MSYELSHLYRFDSFCLDPIEHQLLRDGVSVPLTPKVFDTLRVLVERRGHLVEKEDLMNLVWADAFVEEANLARCIHTLRKALGEEPGGKRYIETVPKRGYRFVAEVQVLENGGTNVMPSGKAEEERQERGPAALEAVQPATPPENDASANDFAPSLRLHIPSPALAGPRHRVHALVFIIPLALLVAAVGAYFYLTRGRSVANDQTPITSIAVLPFVNVGADPDLDYLSDGLSETVIDHLSQLPQLRVIARSSSFKYRGENIDVQDVAAKLVAQAIVLGRVVQRGDSLTVRVELVDARANRQLWGEQYSRRAADIQAVEEEIARTISEKLRLRLTGAQERRLTKRATENARAYQLYLSGLFSSRKGGVEDLRRALDYYHQAVTLDPSFAPAWAGAAMAHLRFAGNSWLDPKEANAKAEATARKALELDETLAEAHLAMAVIKQHEWDWVGAEHEYQRVIEFNPSLVEARSGYSDYLSLMARHTEALAEIKRAQELDPLRIGLRRIEAFKLSLAHRYDEALELIQQTLKEGPLGAGGHRTFGFIYEAKGMYEEAIAAHRKANSMEETTGGLCYLGYALAAAGRRGEARAILGKLNTTKEYVSPAELAGLYATLGDKEGAIALLEKAYAAHDLQMQYLKVEPHYDSLRPDPRFQDLIRRVGLPQ
jgi:TolB-like protein/DNA-binding winged helix-turn-helix (wHTH) protein/Tfp pilus assembly protein PilF